MPTLTPEQHCILHPCRAGRIINAAVEAGEIASVEFARHIGACAVPFGSEGEAALEAAFWDFDAARKSGEERLAFKNVVRALLAGRAQEAKEDP